MTVFKGYLKIIRRNLAYMLAYFAVFVAICILSARLYGGVEESFQQESVDILVSDQDGSLLSETLTRMLSRDNQVETAGADRGKLSEALYSRRAQYVLVIPEGFQEEFAQGAGSLSVTAVPDSAAGYYLDGRIDAFLNQIRVCLLAGYSMEEACKEAADGLEQEPAVELRNTGETERKPYAEAFRYLPYLYLAVLIYSVSYILKAFRSRDVRMRLDASPVPAAVRFLEGAAAFLLLFLLFWSCTMLLPLLFDGTAFYRDALRPLYLANSLLLLADAASVAFLVGTLVQEDNAINALTNIIGLGCSFFCGVFVPLELLGSSVQRIARFLPFYWYELINEELGTHTAMTAEISSAVMQGFLIQGAFALGFFCLTLAVNRQTARKA